MFKLLYKYLCHAGNTLFSVYQQPYSDSWDKELNVLLDNFNTAVLDNYTINLDDKEIWVATKYYNYATEYSKVIDKDKFLFKVVARGDQVRPKFKTMLRLESLVAYVNTLENKTLLRGEVNE